MKKYLIIRCPKCGLVQFVVEGQKTRICPNNSCRYRIPIEKARILLKTRDQTLAVEAVKELKLPRHLRQHFQDIE